MAPPPPKLLIVFHSKVCRNGQWVGTCRFMDTRIMMGVGETSIRPSNERRGDEKCWFGFLFSGQVVVVMDANVLGFCVALSRP